MSFAKDVKLEILSEKIENDCCRLSFLSGLFKAAGEITKSHAGIGAGIISDVEKAYEFVNEIIHELYGSYLELEIEDDFIINKTTYFRTSFPDEEAERILIDIGVLRRTSEGPEILWEIPEDLIHEDCCKKAFVKGAFVGACTSNIKLSSVISQKSSTGYHLEFTSSSEVFLRGLMQILAEYEVLSRLIQRKNIYVLYIKDSGSVENLLAVVEAGVSVVKLTEEMVVRQMRNKVNRETNCISANVSKTVEASYKQVEAIETIFETIGLEGLSEELQEVALLRLANPEESLSDLLSLSTIKLTKSGLNHRFNKIIKLAETLGD